MISRRLNLAAMPPGDRGPHARHLAGRILAALANLEASPRPINAAARAARDQAIARRRAALGRLHRSATRLGLDLPSAVAQYAAPFRTKDRQMSDDAKSKALGDAILAEMKKAIEGGMRPVEAVDTGLMAVGSISIQAEGEYRTGAKLIVIGEGLVDGSPEGTAKRPPAAN